MSGRKDKMKGRAKEAIGKAIRNPRLERAGRREQDLGELKEQARKVKERLEEKVDRALHPEEHADEPDERDG